jgi:hypothetical protein
LEHFSQILQGEGPEQPNNIDVRKALEAAAGNMEATAGNMEATAGNMQMAAQLYWDNYFASQAAAEAVPEAPQGQAQA